MEIIIQINIAIERELIEEVKKQSKFEIPQESIIKILKIIFFCYLLVNLSP